jgi:hypothetical protein
MNAPQEQQFEWTPFSHGFVFWETPTAEHRPPGLENAEGLREWLAGFQQAYADYPDTLDPDDGEPLSAALDRLLAGHSTLPALKMMLRQV